MNDTSLTLYGQLLEELKINPGSSSVDNNTYLGQLVEKYKETFSQLGQQVMEAAGRICDIKNHRASYKISSPYGHQPLSPQDILTECASVNFEKDPLCSAKIASGTIDRCEYRENMRNLFTGRWCGSKFPFYLKAELAASDNRISFSLDTKIWMNDFREGNPSYESCSYYEKTHNFRSVGGALVYIRPNGLPKDQEPSYGYSYSLQQTGLNLSGSSYELVPKEEAYNLNFLLQRLLTAELSYGEKILPFGLIPLFMLAGMRDALHDKAEKIQKKAMEQSSLIENILRT